MATELVYMQDFDVMECTAVVQAVGQTEDGRVDVVLDQTCFYPRGGGQDWDTGLIKGASEFTVEEVRLDQEGVVHHIGHGSLAAGEQVDCQVDNNRRSINTRLHSAGHIVDMAMSSLRDDLVPGRGAHYPHMSFVEYEGVVDNLDELLGQLQSAINEILQKDIMNTLQFVAKDELVKLCRHVPENLPTNKPIRVVLYGDFGVPCGGTHVRKPADIGKIEITKIKSKKGLTKVSYRVEGIN